MASKRFAGLVLAVALLVSCRMTQFGPWLDESGQRLEGSQVIEYQGFAECGHEDVVFLVFFGAMYAKDTAGVLGELTNAGGEVLTFTVLDDTPAGVTATGLTSGPREIFFDEATRDDYIYVRLADGRLERWPRAESPCDLPGSPG
ncbi:MAG TPA: hypothetical protein VIA81_09625 [Acidimicrobiia bacterium]